MDKNLSIYNDTEVVDFYTSRSELYDSEAYLVERYFPKNARLLDLGVGGGRTTPALAARASKYIGLDYSAAMVDACRARFPEQTFVKGDASHMPEFPDSCFDAVMFSFNGIDTFGTDEQRARCLREIERVLAPGGSFIFSSHNAGAIFYLPTLQGAAVHQLAWRLVRSAYKTVQIATRNLSTGIFTKGQGYIVDPTHGGLEMYLSTPRTMVPQLENAGFEVSEIIGGRFPLAAPDIMQPWFYYAARKKAS